MKYTVSDSGNLHDDDDLAELSDDEGTGAVLCTPRDIVFEQIKDEISKNSECLSEHSMSELSHLDDSAIDKEAGLRTSEYFTFWPYGFQARAAYEHDKKCTDIMGGNAFLYRTASLTLIFTQIQNTCHFSMS